MALRPPWHGLLAGNPTFFLKELAAALLSSVWAFGFTLAMLWIIDRVTSVRVDEATEAQGLDVGLHGRWRTPSWRERRVGDLASSELSPRPNEPVVLRVGISQSDIARRRSWAIA